MTRVNPCRNPSPPFAWIRVIRGQEKSVVEILPRSYSPLRAPKNMHGLDPSFPFVPIGVTRGPLFCVVGVFSG